MNCSDSPVFQPMIHIYPRTNKFMYMNISEKHQKLLAILNSDSTDLKKNIKIELQTYKTLLTVLNVVPAETQATE